MNAYRTLLEQKIRERRETFEEFAQYAETFAREHDEPGTLSVRHLQRLAAGRRSDGQPLGRPLPATSRLLERIFGIDINELLARPECDDVPDDPIAEVRRKIHVSSSVDMATVDLFREQLGSIRQLDRQLGAVVAHSEVLTKVDQLGNLFKHSITGKIRETLAAILSEFLCLAGWQALDLGNIVNAWGYYSEASSVALQASSPPYFALAEAGRAFVLIDTGEAASAVELLTETDDHISSECPSILRAWLAAALGEAHAAKGDRTRSLHKFDRAADLMLSERVDPSGPYVALDPVHLDRWRGNALTKFTPSDATEVLTRSLNSLDRTFVRAETGLRIDLATALASSGELEEARKQAHQASHLATRIGSARQRRRVRSLLTGTSFLDQ